MEEKRLNRILKREVLQARGERVKLRHAGGASSSHAGEGVGVGLGHGRLV